jgi:hypothetical protein
MTDWEQQALFDLGERAVTVACNVDIVEGKCIGFRLEARNLSDGKLLGMTYAPRTARSSGSNLQEALAHVQIVAERYLDPF